MATGTFYLRPSADISLAHPVYPDTLTAGYLAINEEVSDGSATYIGCADVQEDFSCTSKFRMSLNGENKITKVISATLIFNGSMDGYYTEGNSSTSYCYCDVFASGSNVFSDSWIDTGSTPSNTNDLSNADIPNLVSAINNHISANGPGTMPEITIEIANELTNAASGTSSKSSITLDSYVSQVAIALECEYQSDIGIYHKVSGVWKPATAAYKKVNGAWVEITADEAKSTLSSSLCTKA